MTDFVRVVVLADQARAEVIVPARVPVAEVVPDLLRSVGRLDADDVHDGFHVATADGRRLGWESGLTRQGVVDGTRLVVLPRGPGRRWCSRYDEVLPTPRPRRRWLRPRATTRAG